MRLLLLLIFFTTFLISRHVRDEAVPCVTHSILPHAMGANSAKAILRTKFLLRLKMSNYDTLFISTRDWEAEKVEYRKLTTPDVSFHLSV